LRFARIHENGNKQYHSDMSFVHFYSSRRLPNGVRYPLVGWRRQRRFDGIDLI
jgi:hypothetical protein